MPGRKRIIQLAVVGMGFLLLMFLAAVVTLKVMTWGQTVAVPDIVGKDLTDAVTLLGEKDLEVAIEGQEHHQSIPQNAVIYQDPVPGVTVKKGRSVSVVVSLGSLEVGTPQLVGEQYKRGQIILTGAGLTLGEVEKVSSGQPRDSVMAQYPPADTVLQKGGRVDLLVSSGPPTPVFVMTDLTGRGLREAESVAQSMALKVVSGGKGSVIVSQNPAPGYLVRAGGTLFVTLGSGKPAPAQPGKPAPAPSGKPAPAQPVKPAPAPTTKTAPAQTVKPAGPAAPAPVAAPVKPATPVPAPAATTDNKGIKQ